MSNQTKLKRRAIFALVSKTENSIELSACASTSCGVNVIAKPRWSAVVFCASRRRAAASRSSVKLARSAALGDGRTLANREKLRMHADAATCGCGHLFRPGVKSKHARSGGCRRRLIANHMPRPGRNRNRRRSISEGRDQRPRRRSLAFASVPLAVAPPAAAQSCMQNDRRWQSRGVVVETREEGKKGRGGIPFLEPAANQNHRYGAEIERMALCLERCVVLLFNLFAPVVGLGPFCCPRPLLPRDQFLLAHVS
jgi:hypothetical protein